MCHMCITLCMVCVRPQHVCHGTVGLVCLCSACVCAQRVSMLRVCLCSAQQQALCSQSDMCVCSTCRAAYKPYVTCQQVGLLVLMLGLACVLRPRAECMLVVQHMMISGDEVYLTSRSLPSSKHVHGQCLLPCVCGCVRAHAYLVYFACAGSTCPVLIHMRSVLG
jgi:hypothetical protein